MNELKLFDIDPIPKVGSKFTAYALKAIDWYADHYNLRPELSTPPVVNLTMKDLGETHPVQLKDIIGEYKMHVKEESKRRAREKEQFIHGISEYREQLNDR